MFCAPEILSGRHGKEEKARSRGIELRLLAFHVDISSTARRQRRSLSDEDKMESCAASQPPAALPEH
jgi:hypothetical protein